jgi:hypothetical protein
MFITFHNINKTSFPPDNPPLPLSRCLWHGAPASSSNYVNSTIAQWMELLYSLM